MKRTLQFLFIMILAVFMTPNIANAQVTTFPYSEGFENAGSIPTGWTNDASDAGGDWQFVTSNSHGPSADHTSGAGYYALLNDYSVSTSNSPFNLLSPTFDLSTVGKTYQLTYWAWIGADGATNPIKVYVSSDGGTNWTLVFTHDHSTTNTWFQNTISLASYTTSTVVVKFEGTSIYGYSTDNSGIDDVVIEEVPACPPPTTPMITSLSTTSAQLNWTSGGSTHFNVEYGPVGFTQGTGTMLSIATDTFAVLSNLTAATSYDWYVRDSCNATDISTWVGPNTFTTNCNVVSTFPWTESFENNFNFLCWDNTGTSSYIWETNDGTTHGPGSVTNGTMAAMFNVYNASTGNTATMTTPTFDMSTMTSSVVSFDYWMSGSADADLWIKVEQSVDNGVTWTTIFTKVQDGTISSWTSEMLVLQGVSATTKLRFVASSDWGSYNIFIDNIKVYQAPSNEIEVAEVLGTFGGFNAPTASVVKAVVMNNGAVNQTNIPMNYTLDNGTVISDTMPALAAFTTDTFTFATPVNGSAVGMHTLTVFSTLTGDEDSTNNSASLSFVTNAVTTVPSTFGFPNTYDARIQLVNNAKSFAAIDSIANNGSGNGIHFEGGSSSWGSTPSTVTAAFAYTDHIAKADAVVDATAKANLFVSLDLKEFRAFGNQHYTWFRVMLNDTVYAKSLDGDSVWTPSSDETPWQAIVLNLNDYAGTIFNISFQGALKYNEAYSAPGCKIYLDNIHFYEPPQNDLSVTTLVSPVSSICNDTAANVSVVVANPGIASQSNIPVTAIVTLPNGTNVTLTGITGTIGALGGVDTVSMGTLNTSAYGTYNVSSYATLATDQDNSNDTLSASFEIYAPFAVDYVETFDGNSLYWAATPGWSVSASHGKTGRGLYKDFYGSGTNASGYAFMNRKIGPIPAGADLVFDYRIINWSGYPNTATTLDADSFFFMVSNNCGASFDTLYVVDSTNHVTTTAWAHVQVSMAAYAGQNVIIEIAGQRTAGDYYFDLDNFGIATPPSVDLGPDMAICIGDTASINGPVVSGYTYMWTANGDTLSTTASSIQTDSTGIYTIEVSAPMGVVYDTINVTVNALPVVSFTGLAATYCTNDMAATLVGTPANGTFSGNGVSASMFDPAIAGAGVQVVNYTYTDSNTCTNSINDTTTVYEAPTATMTPDTTICEGESVTLSAGSAVATPGVFFSSYIEGSGNNKALEIYNGTNDTISLDNYAIMTNYNGHPWSGEYHFPTGAQLAPGDVFVVANEASNAAILAVADDSLAYNAGGYVVGFNGDDVRALYKFNTPTDSAIVDIIGRYDLVDPGHGWAVAGVADATKDHTLIRKSNVVGGSNDWDAIAGTDSLNSQYLVYPKNDFSMLGSHTAMASVAPSYLWSNGDTTVSITVNPTTTTVYTVNVSNTNCVAVDSVTVTVNPMPVVNLGADTTIKWSWALTLDAGNPNASYLWSTGATTQTETFDSLNLTNDAANTVYVDVTANGCSASDTIVITVMNDVSINNALSNVNMTIYPNPNNGHYTMVINGYTGEINMEVIDLAGQLVYKEKLDATTNFNAKFDMSTLAKGVYYIKLTNKDGVKTQKLIIK